MKSIINTKSSLHISVHGDPLLRPIFIHLVEFLITPYGPNNILDLLDLSLDALYIVGALVAKDLPIIPLVLLHELLNERAHIQG